MKRSEAERKCNKLECSGAKWSGAKQAERIKVNYQFEIRLIKAKRSGAKQDKIKRSEDWIGAERSGAKWNEVERNVN